MVSLADRKSKLTFAVNAMVREQGRLREVVLTPRPGHLEIRAKGMRTSYFLDYAWLYQTAVKRTVDQQKAERKAARKAAR